VWHGTETTAVITPVSRSETFYLKARDAGGRYSQTAAVKTITNNTPTTPDSPTVGEFFSALWITINPVPDNDIVAYTLYMTPVDESGDPTGDTQVTTYLNAGRVTYNASPGTRFRVEVAAADVLGEGSKSTPVYARTRKIEGVAEFAQGLTPPRIVDELPTLPDSDYPEGCLVVLTTDHVLYRCTGTTWDASVDVDLIAGQIQAGMIAAGAIGADEIAAGEILADHFAAGSIEAYVAAVQEAFIDSAHIIEIEADKIKVGGGSPGISLTKPAGAHLWHFDGSLMSTDGISPESGAVATLRPNGRFGGAVAVEVGTTNLAGTDNSFEDGVNGFMAYGGKGTVTQSSEFSYSGSSSLKFVCTATGTTGVVKTLPSGSSYAGKTLTLSWRVKGIGSSIGKQVFANIYDNVTGSSGGSKITLDETWQTIYVTKTINSGASTVNIYWLSDQLSINDVVYGDCVLLEENPFPTSFTTGTRAAGGLTHLAKDIINPAAGTIHLYLQTPVLDENWFLWDTSINRHQAFYRASTGKLEIWWNNAVQMSAALPPDKAWHTITVMWQGEQTSLLIDGEDKATGTIPGGIQLADGELFTWGSRYNYVNQATKLIDELLVAPFAATPEQVAAWYAMGAPFVDPNSAINADASPISAAGGQVYIGEPGIAVANGAMIFVSGTFSHDQLGRLITAAVDRPITTDPSGQKSVSAPVEISAARGHEVYKGKLNVWAGTGGAGDKRYIHDGRVTDDGIIGMDALKLTGTVAMENLPAHLLRTAPGVSGSVMYWGETYVAAQATVTITFDTAMPYTPTVIAGDKSSLGSLSGTVQVSVENIATTGFRFRSASNNNHTLQWIALCASDDPASSSCSACQERCQNDCQTGCEDACQAPNGCQDTCESDCQTTCEGSCQDTCMFSCQLPPPLTLWN
jgi:hypothetical protein